MTVEECLRTTYRPDRDYVDGEVLDRNLGDFAHSITQAEVGVWLHGKFPKGARRVLPEQRVQVKATRYRMDANLLVALIAPRPLLMQMGSMDKWSDLYAKQGLGVSEVPAAGVAILHTMGYLMHNGGRGMVPTDWDVFVQFLKTQFSWNFPNVELGITS